MFILAGSNRPLDFRDSRSFLDSRVQSIHLISHTTSNAAGDGLSPTVDIGRGHVTLSTSRAVLEVDMIIFGIVEMVCKGRKAKRCPWK